jgi:hypothetical protein
MIKFFASKLDCWGASYCSESREIKSDAGKISISTVFTRDAYFYVAEIVFDFAHTTPSSLHPPPSITHSISCPSFILWQLYNDPVSGLRGPIDIAGI